MINHVGQHTDNADCYLGIVILLMLIAAMAAFMSGRTSGFVALIAIGVLVMTDRVMYSKGWVVLKSLLFSVVYVLVAVFWFKPNANLFLNKIFFPSQFRMHGEYGESKMYDFSSFCDVFVGVLFVHIFRAAKPSLDMQTQTGDPDDDADHTVQAVFDQDGDLHLRTTSK